MVSTAVSQSNGKRSRRSPSIFFTDVDVGPTCCPSMTAFAGGYHAARMPTGSIFSSLWLKAQGLLLKMEPMYSLIMSSSGFHAPSWSLLHIRGSKPMRDCMLSLHVLHIVLSPVV